MGDANGKPLDLGSVVEALEQLGRAVSGRIYDADDPIVDALESCGKALNTLRSTVTPAPVAIVDTIEQALKFYAFSDNKIDGTPIRDIACRVATTLRSTVTPAPVAGMTTDQLYDEGYRDGLKDGIRDGKKEATPAPVAKVVVDRKAIENAMDCIYLDGDTMGASIQGEDQAVKNLLTLLDQLPGVEVK